MRNMIFIVAVVVLSGCASQAGPFVTNISSDGRGGLTVEKCMLRYDRMIHVVESSSCNSSSINLTNGR